MNAAGPAIYFDGKTTARHAVTLELLSSALIVRGQGGEILARWAYDDLEQSSTPDEVFRISRSNSESLERIEVRDPALAKAIDDLSIPLDRSGLSARRSRRKAVLLSMAAVVSILVVAVFGIPELATRLAPHMPYWFEQRLGDAVNGQVRTMLNTGTKDVAFECGDAAAEKPGAEALASMVGRMEKAAQLPIPLRLKVIRRKEANAIALPGGYVYVFQGLIDQAQNADEVAGVIAHEIGHIAHRDGMRAVLQAGGLAFVFGLVLGDFVGGGAVVIASKTLLQLAYSRDVEAAADRYAVDLMSESGGDARALGAILKRIAGKEHTSILANHPATRERALAIEAAVRGAAKGAALTDAEWSALKRICG